MLITDPKFGTHPNGLDRWIGRALVWMVKTIQSHPQVGPTSTSSQYKVSTSAQQRGPILFRKFISVFIFVLMILMSMCHYSCIILHCYTNH